MFDNYFIFSWANSFRLQSKTVKQLCSGFETLKFRKSSENYLIRSTVELLNQSCLMVGVYTSAVIGQVGELPINHRSRNSKAKGIPLYAKNQIYKKKNQSKFKEFWSNWADFSREIDMHECIKILKTRKLPAGVVLHLLGHLKRGWKPFLELVTTCTMTEKRPVPDFQNLNCIVYQSFYNCSISVYDLEFFVKLKVPRFGKTIYCNKKYFVKSLISRNFT